jgi:DNA-binding transcriptional MerR regulator
MRARPSPPNESGAHRDLHRYTLESVNRLLGLSRHAVRRLVQLGFVTPARGARNAYLFSFQDMVVLRSAHNLHAARIPVRQILRSLSALRRTLPRTPPSDGLRVVAAGSRVAVQQGERRWEPDTGQMVLDLAIGTPQGGVRFLSPASAQERFSLAESLEQDQPAAAEAAYREAIRLDDRFAPAYLNLGFLLCESDRCEDAAALYDQGVRRCPDEPLMHYNHAVALDNLGRSHEALAAYERSIALDPALADAHQNAALLYAEVGEKQLAIRHFNAYRRLRGRHPAA